MRLSPALLPLMLLLATPAAGQGYEGVLKIGGAVSRLSGGDAETLDPRAGLAGGVAFGYSFGNGLLIQPEALYATRGAHADAVLTDEFGSVTPVRVRYDLTYLEFPLLLVYRPPARRRVRPRVFAGPAFGARLHGSILVEPAGGGVEQTLDDEDAEGTILNGHAGAGAEVEVGAERLVLGVRYTFSLTPMRQREPDRHSGVLFFVGIAF